MSEDHVVTNGCLHCGHPEIETVDTRIKGWGSGTTLAVRECQGCGQLWGERRDWYGVEPNKGGGA